MEKTETALDLELLKTKQERLELEVELLKQENALFERKVKQAGELLLDTFWVVIGGTAKALKTIIEDITKSPHH